jgi:ATP-dependent DNA helicase RecG
MPRPAPSRNQVEILQQCGQESALADLMAHIDRTVRTKFRNQVIRPLLLGGLLEMTIPDKPTSSKQRYCLTEKGRDLLATLATSAP